MKKDVKDNLLDHSQAKVNLLGKYLTRYLAVISNTDYVRRIRVYDLFCGEGIYQDGGEGSPIVILHAIQELHQSGRIKDKIPHIDCFFNDVSQPKIEKLKQIVSEWNPEQIHGKITLTSNDYQDELKNLIESLPNLKNEEAFVFIDPYEYKHIKASHIRDLLRSKNAEVLLWLPTQFMYRFESNGTPQALKDMIEELVPFDRWKQSDSVWQFIDQLKSELRNYLGHEFFVDTFTIQKDPQTVFCLFFFSSHIRGFEKMLEAKWAMDQDSGKGWKYHKQQDLFAALETNVLEEQLKLFLNVGKTNGEIYEFTLHAGFLPTHAVEILTSLQDNGTLEVLCKNGEPARKKAFYISYKNYKIEPQKVKIKLK